MSGEISSRCASFGIAHPSRQMFLDSFDCRCEQGSRSFFRTLSSFDGLLDVEESLSMSFNCEG